MTATNVFGRTNIVPLTNKSGGSVAAGDLVYLNDGSNADSFTTGTTANYTGAIGVAQGTIANNAVGLVAISGYVALVNVNASVTIKHYGSSYTVAKQATDAGTSRAAGTFCQFQTGGTTPDAIIWQPDLGGGSGMTNPMTTTGDTIYSSDNSGTPARKAIGSAGQVLGVASGIPSWIEQGGSFFSFHPGFADPTATTGTWTFIANTDTGITGLNGYPNYVNNATGAQNDAISFDLWMAAGTYTVTCMFRKSSNTAIITVNLDGSSQGTIDTYAASPVYASGSVSSIAVTQGKRTWQFKAATKNASSSGYNLEFYSIVIRRTA